MPADGSRRFFWRVADGDCNECTFNGSYPDITSDVLWHPDCSAGYDLGVNRGASWYVGADDKYVDPKVSIEQVAQSGRVQRGQPLAGDGRRQARGHARLRGLLVDALDGRLPGRKTTVSFKMYGKNIEATDKATPVVYVQFINATGRQMTRAYIVGKRRRRRSQAPRTHQGHVRLDRA